MAWNCVPYWCYQMVHEHDIASNLCCFEQEWFSGTSKVMPDNIIKISKATFSSYDYGGWNQDDK
jgi:hypothetical protein